MSIYYSLFPDRQKAVHSFRGRQSTEYAPCPTRPAQNGTNRTFLRRLLTARPHVFGASDPLISGADAHRFCRLPVRAFIYKVYAAQTSAAPWRQPVLRIGRHSARQENGIISFAQNNILWFKKNFFQYLDKPITCWYNDFCCVTRTSCVFVRYKQQDIVRHHSCETVRSKNTEKSRL